MHGFPNGPRICHEVIVPDPAVHEQVLRSGLPEETMADLGFARLDTGRAARTGDPEVVFGTGKTPDELVAILARLAEAHPDRAVLATRCPPASLAACRRSLPGADVDDRGRTVVIGPPPEPAGLVAVVTAGTADLPVALEAAATVRVFGSAADLIPDVGVSGPQRLFAVWDRVAAADAVVVVAGMEGALPSVVGGMTGQPLIAVPTSVGYGLSMEGVTTLLAMLNSCAPGVTVVNVDNGFGGGVAAARIARTIGRLRAAAQP